MPHKDPKTGETPAEKLNQLIQDDLTDRIHWQDEQRTIRRARLGERRNKRNMYPGYPNFLEPIIDDNVRGVTSAESSVIWSGTRYLANFVPLDKESMKLKRRAEVAFDTLLKITLDLRAKLDALLDRKNEGGMSVAKMIENRDVMIGNVVPDFDEVDPFDLIVPTGTRKLRSAERVTHIIRYTEGEFRKIGKDRNWKNVEKVIERTHDRQKSARQADQSVTRLTESDPTLIGLNSMPTNLDWIIVYEVYHFDDERQQGVRIFSPVAPDLEIAEFPWIYPEQKLPDGRRVIEVRPWPFVQFRYENRSLYYYDTRGIGKLLEDNQKAATQMLNAKGVMLDFTTFPFTKGNRGGLQNFRFRPGEHVPNDFEIVKGPSVDPILDINVDRERQSAARRVGGSLGALTSPLSVKTPKTATEINRVSASSNQLSADTIMRFSEPLGDLFQMMWDFLRHHPINLPVPQRDDVVFLTPEDMQKTQFKLVPAISSRNFNPDFILQQLRDLSPFFLNSPVLRQAKFQRFAMDQIDPMFTEELIFDPEEEGTEGSDVPLIQQVQQMADTIQQMAVVVQSHQEQLEAEAGLVVSEAEEDERENQRRATENVEPVSA